MRPLYYWFGETVVQDFEALLAKAKASTAHSHETSFINSKEADWKHDGSQAWLSEEDLSYLKYLAARG